MPRYTRALCAGQSGSRAIGQSGLSCELPERSPVETLAFEQRDAPLIASVGNPPEQRIGSDKELISEASVDLNGRGSQRVDDRGVRHRGSAERGTLDRMRAHRLCATSINGAQIPESAIRESSLKPAALCAQHANDRRRLERAYRQRRCAGRYAESGHPGDSRPLTQQTRVRRERRRAIVHPSDPWTRIQRSFTASIDPEMKVWRCPPRVSSVS